GGAGEMALAAPPDLGRYREALADCVEEADRVVVMLNTLMDISEAESGAMQLQRTPVLLTEVVARAVDLYRDVAEAKGVGLEIRIEPDTTPVSQGEIVVMGDRTRLEQVAANLIDNAVKYTAPSGRVEVTVGREDGQAVLSVRDTGAGIRPDELTRIMDRIFTGDADSTELDLDLWMRLW